MRLSGKINGHFESSMYLCFHGNRYLPERTTDLQIMLSGIPILFFFLFGGGAFFHHQSCSVPIYYFQFDVLR